MRMVSSLVLLQQLPLSIDDLLQQGRLGREESFGGVLGRVLATAARAGLKLRVAGCSHHLQVKVLISRMIRNLFTKVEQGDHA